MYSIDFPLHPHLMMQSLTPESLHTSLMVSLALGWLLMHHLVDLPLLKKQFSVVAIGVVAEASSHAF